MIDYDNPSRKRKPDLYIFHAGTNDLRFGKRPEEIADEIIEVAASLQTNENEVAVSAIVTRNDNLNDKGKRVNEFLKLKTRQFDLAFIDHSNISSVHLNNSGLHLTEDGDKLLRTNFRNFIML